MNQTVAVTQWWAGLTSTERRAVLRLPVGGGVPPHLAVDLAENGVVLQRVDPRATDAPALTSFPAALREHLARVRSERVIVVGRG